jgi:hypothetical protein
MRQVLRVRYEFFVADGSTALLLLLLLLLPGCQLPG